MELPKTPQDIIKQLQELTEASSSRSIFYFENSDTGASHTLKMTETADVNILSNGLQNKSAYDVILGNIPFHQKMPENSNCYAPPGGNADFLFLMHIFENLSDEGRAAVIMPNSSLSSMTAYERDLRIWLAKNGFIRTIIAMPSGLFRNTSVAFCIWILCRNPSDKQILMIDARKYDKTQFNQKISELYGKFIRGEAVKKTFDHAVVSLEQIEHNDYILSPNLYTLKRVSHLPQDELGNTAERLIQLIDDENFIAILQNIKTLQPSEQWHCAPLPELYRAKVGLMNVHSTIGEETPLLTFKQLLRSPFLAEPFDKTVTVSKKEKDDFSIRKGDIFLTRTGRTLQAFAQCCVADRDYPAVFGGFLTRLRPLRNNNILSDYAAAFLQSEVYRQNIETITPVFTKYASLNRRLLSKIDFWFPDEAAQALIGSAYRASCQMRQTCQNDKTADLLQQFEKQLTERLITDPILKRKEEHI